MPPDFDRIARPYRWLEYLSFGPMLERCRFYRLAAPDASPDVFPDASIGTRRSALVLGDGDGRFLARLLDRNRQLHAEAVDTSPAMLKLLEERAGSNATGNRLTTHCQDARSFNPTGSYDLVATHFFLDCLTTDEILALARRIRSRLLPGAVWITSDFAIPQGAAALPARLVVSCLYSAFGVLTGLEVRTLPRHSEALTEAGFALSDRREWLGGILYSEVWRPKATDDALKSSH